MARLKPATPPGAFTAMAFGASIYLMAMVFSPAAPAQQNIERSEQHDFQVVTLAEGLEHPWGMAFLPDGGILITERPGRLRLFKDGKLLADPIPGGPQAIARGQGGLLDVALHPDFATNGYLYFSYTGADPAKDQRLTGTEVARARFDGRELTALEVIFRALPKTPGGAHYGSRLVFSRDGKLFVSLGDRRNYMKEAQNPANHLGSILRLNDDGSLPEDNPFAGQTKVMEEIFTYGHRNVQGLALHPSSGEIWAHEHGPRGGDEVNLLKSGANYGWPAITYGIDYSGAIISEKTSAPGMEQPVVYWDPSIAPSGMAFYDGDLFAQWKGDLFVGALAHRHLRRLEMDGQKVVGQEALLRGLRERIRDVRSGPDGFIYLLTDSARGRLIRLEPAAR